MSKGVGKVGVSLVKAPVLGPGIPSVIVEGCPISVVGDRVTPHGDPPHNRSILITGNPMVLAGGRPITRDTSNSTCGHILTNGAPMVRTS